MAKFAESSAFSAKRHSAREVCSITDALLIVSVNETKVQKRTKLPVRAQSENQISQKPEEQHVWTIRIWSSIREL